MKVRYYQLLTLIFESFNQNYINSKDLDILLSEVSSYRKEALDCLSSASSSKEVENFRVLFLGKNGKVTGVMKQMKTLPNGIYCETQCYIYIYIYIEPVKNIF